MCNQYASTFACGTDVQYLIIELANEKHVHASMHKNSWMSLQLHEYCSRVFYMYTMLHNCSFTWSSLTTIYIYWYQYQIEHFSDKIFKLCMNMSGNLGLSVIRWCGGRVITHCFTISKVPRSILGRGTGNLRNASSVSHLTKGVLVWSTGNSRVYRCYTLSTYRSQRIYSQRARVSLPDSLYLNTASSVCCLFSKNQRTPLEISA